MQQKVFAVRDSKAECFGNPLFMKTTGEAERGFKTAVNSPETAYSKYPEDYDLYEIGSYDDQTGTLTAFETPHHVVKAIFLKDSAPNNVKSLSN